MTDLLLRWSGSALSSDYVVSENDLAGDDGLESAIVLSLFTDAQAEPGDVLPAGSEDRRGFWGDGVPVAPGDRFGSRLWLLERSKQTADVLVRARQYAREALQWLIDDRVASSVDVRAEFMPRGQGLLLRVVVSRTGGSVASYQFSRAWDAAARGI